MGGVLGLTEGQLALPVRLTLPHYLHSPTVTFSHPPSGQVVTATLLPLLSSCPANNSGIISALLGSLLLYWQSVLVTLLAVALATYLTRKSLKQGSSPPPAQPHLHLLLLYLPNNLKRLEGLIFGLRTRALSMEVQSSGGLPPQAPET